MCGLFSMDSTRPSTRTLPSPALGPWVRELGAQPAPQQLDLPTCFLAATQPPSPILAAGEGAEQSHGPPHPGSPHSLLLVALGEGQKTSCTLTLSQCPAPPRCLAPAALRDRWDADTAATAWSPTSFWGAQPGWGEFCWAWGNRWQSWPSLGACTPLPQSLLAWQHHTAAVLAAGLSSAELSQGCSSTLPAPHQLCSRLRGKRRRQPGIPPGSRPRGRTQAQTRGSCPVPGEPQAGLFLAQG